MQTALARPWPAMLCLAANSLSLIVCPAILSLVLLSLELFLPFFFFLLFFETHAPFDFFLSRSLVSCLFTNSQEKLFSSLDDRISHANTTTTTARRTGVSNGPGRGQHTEARGENDDLTRASFHVCTCRNREGTCAWWSRSVPRRIEHDSPADLRTIASTPVCATCLRRRVRSNSGRGSSGEYIARA